MVGRSKHFSFDPGATIRVSGDRSFGNMPLMLSVVLGKFLMRLEC
jgi:hypothetical protein